MITIEAESAATSSLGLLNMKLYTTPVAALLLRVITTGLTNVNVFAV